MAKKTPTYQEALDELESIVQSLEQGELNVDELSGKVKKAAELLHSCKEKLRTVEEEVEGLLDGEDGQ